MVREYIAINVCTCWKEEIRRLGYTNTLYYIKYAYMHLDYTTYNGK